MTAWVFLLLLHSHIHAADVVGLCAHVQAPASAVGYRIADYSGVTTRKA